MPAKKTIEEKVKVKEVKTDEKRTKKAATTAPKNSSGKKSSTSQIAEASTSNSVTSKKVNKTSKTSTSATQAKKTKQRTTTKAAEKASKKATSKIAKSATKEATATKSKKTTKKASKQSTTKVTKKSAVGSKKASTKKSNAKKAHVADKTTIKAFYKTSAPKKFTGKLSLGLTILSRKKIMQPEYYDLPYRYNETIVRVLAQTPKSLFVYWDVSDKDRANFIKTFGENFFNDTIPFLRITNESANYSFDVDVDDFANGWYVSVEDSKCTYSVSLLRRQKPFRDKIIDHEIYITTSNKIEAPNDHMLFENFSPIVSYKNVKNQTISTKNIATMTYKNSRKAIYGLYEHYQEIYQSEDIEEIFDLRNPSSSNPTSTFK